MSNLREYFKANAKILHHQARLKILRQKNRRITCNRKDLQQLVAGSTAVVCAPRNAIGNAFQLEYAVKRIIYLKTEVHKNKRIKGLSAIEICASLVKLRDRELSEYVPR